jgi:transcriptional regulator with XRE-family HTH domain
MPSKKSPANQALGKAARSARNRLGVSQEAQAARAKVDRAYYGAFERGEFNLSLDTIVKIATALHMKPSELLKRAKL